MALTMPRWLLAALAGIAIAFVLIVPEIADESPRSRQSRLLNEVESRYQGRVRTLSTRLRVQRTVDSIRATFRTKPAADVRVAISATLPPDARIAAESLIARARAGVTGPIATGVDIAVIHDTTMQYGILASYALPTGPQDRCLVVLPMAPRANTARSVTRMLRTQAATDQLLGPCRYMMAFGPPGSKIRQWLDRRGWMLGADGSFTHEIIWDLGALSQLTGRMSLGAWDLSPSAAECLGGVTSTCESAAMNAVRYRGLVYNGYILAEQFPRLGRDNFGVTRLGFRENYLLADMARALGREQFAKFWRSDAEVAAAFEQATGTRLGDWIASWMQRQYGGIERRPAIMSGYSAIVALLIITLAVFIGVRVAAHRQFV